MIEVNIIGSGGHARSLLSLLAENESIKVNGVYDSSFDKFPNERIGKTNLIGTPESLVEQSGLIVLATGDVKEKKKMFDQFESRIYSENINYKLFRRCIFS